MPRGGQPEENKYVRDEGREGGREGEGERERKREREDIYRLSRHACIIELNTCTCIYTSSIFQSPKSSRRKAEDLSNGSPGKVPILSLVHH